MKDEHHKYTLKTVDEPFSFEVLRAGESNAIWNTTGHHMLFKDQYLELTTHAHPKSTLYGLGERISSAGAALPMLLAGGMRIEQWLACQGCTPRVWYAVCCRKAVDVPSVP